MSFICSGKFLVELCVLFAFELVEPKILAEWKASMVSAILLFSQTKNFAPHFVPQGNPNKILDNTHTTYKETPIKSWITLILQKLG